MTAPYSLYEMVFRINLNYNHIITIISKSKDLATIIIWEVKYEINFYKAWANRLEYTR